RAAAPTPHAPAAAAPGARPGRGAPGAQAAAPTFPAKLAQAATRAELGDRDVYLQLRTAVAAGDADEATGIARTLVDRFPDSIWAGRAQLDVGRVRRRTRDLNGARDAFAAAAAKLPAGEREVAVASLSRAEAAHEL